jgi:hypothetical protein
LAFLQRSDHCLQFVNLTLEVGNCGSLPGIPGCSGLGQRRNACTSQQKPADQTECKTMGRAGHE